MKGTAMNLNYAIGLLVFLIVLFVLLHVLAGVA